MKIRKDYVGNVSKGKTIHGLKYNTHKPTCIDLFCGCNPNGTTHHISAEKIPEINRKAIAETITCKRCRSIIGLSDEASEKPDYYLIIDTRDENNPHILELVDSVEEAEKALEWKLNEEGETLDSICRFRVTGVVEVERYYQEPKTKVKLHKD